MVQVVHEHRDTPYHTTNRCSPCLSQLLSAPPPRKRPSLAALLGVAVRCACVLVRCPPAPAFHARHWSSLPRSSGTAGCCSSLLRCGTWCVCQRAVQPTYAGSEGCAVRLAAQQAVWLACVLVDAVLMNQSIACRTSSRGLVHCHQWSQLETQHQLAQWRSLQPEVVWCFLLEQQHYHGSVRGLVSQSNMILNDSSSILFSTTTTTNNQQTLHHDTHTFDDTCC